MQSVVGNLVSVVRLVQYQLTRGPLLHLLSPQRIPRRTLCPLYLALPVNIQLQCDMSMGFGGTLGNKANAFDRAKRTYFDAMVGIRVEALW